MEGFRAASHAGSWYSNNRLELDRQLTQWLQSAQVLHSKARALIGPHAGYQYSGATAAWGYVHIDTSRTRRVFLLGPSHHFYLQGCALPCSSSYRTPIGDIPVDTAIIDQLSRTQKFQRLSKSQEEDEHSLEMHLPYIRKVFENKEITLVPVMVGQMGDESEFGQIFAEFFRNDENLFIVSSDFCHWGQRFGFTPYDQSRGQIWQSIEKMDREAMDLIERHDLSGFKRYLSRTRNTICGRNPIILLLSTILAANQDISTKFVKYDQSERVAEPSSSSVSYASSVSSGV